MTFNGDGSPEFAEIGGEVLTVPSPGSSDDDGSWLPSAATVGAAVISAAGVVLVAFMNRQGADQLVHLVERVDRLEQGRPSEAGATSAARRPGGTAGAAGAS